MKSQKKSNLKRFRHLFVEPLQENAPVTRRKAAGMLRILDRFLGLYCVFLTAVTFIHWNRVDWNGSLMAPLVLVFTLGNLFTSQLSMRFSNPKGPELARLILGTIFLIFLHQNAGEAIDNFWFPFLVYSIGFSTVSQIAFGLKRWVILLLIPGLYLALRVIHHQDIYAFVISEDIMIFGALIMTTMFSYEITETLRVLGAELEQQKFKVEQKVKEKTKELNAVQEAKLSNEKFAALGRMAGEIAHEINTPLGAILLSSEAIINQLKKQPIDREKIIELASGIENTTNRIAKITRALRTFSRHGKDDPYVHTCMLVILEEVLALVRHSFDLAGIELRLDLQGSDVISIECQEALIGQVLVNLLSNSKFAVENSIEKWVELTVVDAGEFVEIYVKDSGCGIPENVRNNLFQPFFTTKATGKGTGMGMAITKSIVDHHSGKIELLDAEPFTTFKIVLPKLQDRSWKKAS